ncbi:hypothetical protein B0H17DRAFT_1143118 [Mycena rosella]|uniref:Uncharacterized protein n=1 Tax=Mycena rosella TaxID=1033263 RepID=A0AAD7CZK7_MYCRO|nr:hypothetical protein B0H17DRAFT_1143118 [Mycena rosella]
MMNSLLSISPIFQRWLQSHIPRFGVRCAYLARFELFLESDMPLRILMDAISSLPPLTHLRIYGEGGYGLLESAPVPPTDTFPPHFHTLDIALRRGTNLFFEWLIPYEKSPVFTSLTLGGRANGAPLGPIEAYLKCMGTKTEALSLSYWADGPMATYDLETRVLASTDMLVHLSLARLTHPSSLRLAMISIEVRPVPDYVLPVLSSIDALLGTPQYGALPRLSFTDEVSKKPINTAELRALIPQASARGLLDWSHYVGYEFCVWVT